MIEFSCIYCGQPVRAGEKLARKRILCPTCGHSIVVRKKGPGAALKSTRRGGDDETRKDAGHWADRSDEEIVDELLSRTFTKQERRKRAVKKLLSPLLPRYDDLTLFSLGLTFVLLWSINGDLRRDLVKAFSSDFPGELTALLALAVIGLGISLLNVFWRRDKSEFERLALLIFAVLVTAGTGVYSGWIMLQGTRGWLLVFPAWNLLNGGLLLLLFRFGIVDTDCIIDKKATFAQVIVTVISATVLLLVCQCYFELHWSLTFSIAVAYTMSLHNTLRDLFGRRPPPPAVLSQSD